MVIGLEAFREAFKGYEDCYTIIGGTAGDILMNKANLDFRATIGHRNESSFDWRNRHHQHGGYQTFGGAGRRFNPLKSGKSNR